MSMDWPRSPSRNSPPGFLKQKNGAALLLHPLERAGRPLRFQRVFKLIFMAHAVKEAARRGIGGGNDGKHSHGCAFSPVPPPADGDIPVLEHGPEITIAGGG